MSGRNRPTYNTATSPSWNLGHDDGRADREYLCKHPDGNPIGPNPPDPHYRKMYDLGYEAGFQGE